MVNTQKRFKIITFMLIIALMFTSLMIATNKSKPVHADTPDTYHSHGLYQAGTYLTNNGEPSDSRVLVKTIDQLISDGDISVSGFANDIITINNKNLEGDLVVCSAAFIYDEDIYKSMFEGCSKLTTIVVECSESGNRFKNLSRMFYGCTSLKTVCLDGVVINSDADVTDMFTGCKNLSEIRIFQANHTFKELGLIYENYSQDNTQYTEDSNIPSLDYTIVNGIIKLSGYKGQTVAQTGIVTDMLGITMLAVMVLVLAYFLTRKKVNKSSK